MKKIIMTVLLATTLAATACGSKTPAATNNFNYKVGTASYTHTNDSYGYTEGKNGRSSVSTTLVAAVFDTNGNIVRISIDEVESKIGIDGAGQLADFTAGEVQSKKELRDAYGMKAYSSIGKEWYQQVESLEKWLEGKPVNTITGNTNTKAVSPSSTDNSYYNSDSLNAGNNTKSAADAATDTADKIMDGVNSAIDNMTDGNTNSNINGNGYNNAGTENNMNGNSYNSTGTGPANWMDEDIKASVTIDTANIEKAIEKAWRNAK